MSLRSGQALTREGALGHPPSPAHGRIGDAWLPGIDPGQDGVVCSGRLDLQP
jgi:hypothetical protein